MPFRLFPSLMAFLAIALTTVPATGQNLLRASLVIPAQAGVMTEACGAYELVIERGPDNSAATEVFVSGTGAAVLGTDYSFPDGAFPFSLAAGETERVIPVLVNADGTPEGLEDLTLELAFLAGTESGVILLESGIVDDYSVSIDFPDDTITWCRYMPFELTATSDAQVQWSPGPAFEPNMGDTVTVRPIASAWYYAMVGTAECGALDSIYFEVAAADIIPDTGFICAGEPGFVIPGRLLGPATDFTWIPADGTLSDPNSLTPVATPAVTTTYILETNIGVCTARDTIVIRVDSLPADLHIDIAPLKAYYCAGEVVAVFSPTYDSLAYPDIAFLWTPDNGTYLTDRGLLNAALELQDTTLYIREVTNNACVSEDSILINVVPSGVPLSVSDTTLCPGEQFQVVVLNDQVREPEWEPAEGLSCTKCLDPVVTVQGLPGMTVTYQFSGMILDCPVGATLTIRIPPVQPIPLDADQVVCGGDQVPITITDLTGLSDFQWTILEGNGSLSCTSCPDPVVTVNATDIINILVAANTTNPAFCGAQGFIQLRPGTEQQVIGPSFQACLGSTVQVSTGDPSLTNVSWDVISGNLSINNPNNPMPIVEVNGGGLLRFFAESADPDVCRVVGTVAVSPYPPDESNLLLDPDPNGTDIGQGSEVMAMLNVNEAPPTNIMWTVNGQSVTSNTTSIKFNAEEEVNFIEVKFTNSKGCEQIDTLSFPTVPPSWMIPNAFTPDNGDDINDKFRVIINGNIVLESFVIFNRWGQKVYEARDGDTEGWDGRHTNGEPASSDTYVYRGTLRYPDGRTEQIKGDVILIK